MKFQKFADCLYGILFTNQKHNIHKNSNNLTALRNLEIAENRTLKQPSWELNSRSHTVEQHD